MNKIKTLALYSAVIAALALGLSPRARAALEDSVYRLMVNGLTLFKIESNTALDNSLRVHELTGDTVPLVVSTNGRVGLLLAGNQSPLVDVEIGSQRGLQLGRFTSTQLQARTPAFAGELVFNTTIGIPCISTGSSVFGYVAISSRAPNGNFASCN